VGLGLKGRDKQAVSFVPRSKPVLVSLCPQVQQHFVRGLFKFSLLLEIGYCITCDSEQSLQLGTVDSLQLGTVDSLQLGTVDSLQLGTVDRFQCQTSQPCAADDSSQHFPWPKRHIIAQ
jgi:hypothetical protein